MWPYHVPRHENELHIKLRARLTVLTLSKYAQLWPLGVPIALAFFRFLSLV